MGLRLVIHWVILKHLDLCSVTHWVILKHLGLCSVTHLVIQMVTLRHLGYSLGFH